MVTKTKNNKGITFSTKLAPQDLNESHIQIIFPWPRQQIYSNGKMKL